MTENGDTDKPKSTHERLIHAMDKLMGELGVRYQEPERDRQPREPGPPTDRPLPKTRDFGVTSDGRVVEVPDIEPDPRSIDEKMHDAAQERFAKELADYNREREERKRREGLTKDPEARAQEKAQELADREKAKESPIVEIPKRDSPAYRAALARYMQAMGVAPELQAIRMLGDVGQAAPPEEAVRKRERDAEAARKALEKEGRTPEPPAQEPGGGRP